MHVAGQAIELCDDHRALDLSRLRKRGRKFRAAIERISALARLDLDMLGDQIDSLRLGEALDGGALSFEP
jgi:hypothetical protein